MTNVVPIDKPKIADLENEFRKRLYYLASEARLISLAALAINEDQGAESCDTVDANTAFAIERAATRIEESLLDLAGGEGSALLNEIRFKEVRS